MDGLVGVRSDVRIEVERGPVRPLWTAHAGTMALYERARRIAGEIGFDLPHGQHGGGSDGNFTGAMGVATLDGLGVMGGGAHTHEEHILRLVAGAAGHADGAPPRRAGVTLPARSWRTGVARSGRPFISFQEEPGLCPR